MRNSSVSSLSVRIVREILVKQRRHQLDGRHEHVRRQCRSNSWHRERSADAPHQSMRCDAIWYTIRLSSRCSSAGGAARRGCVPTHSVHHIAHDSKLTLAARIIPVDHLITVRCWAVHRSNFSCGAFLGRTIGFSKVSSAVPLGARAPIPIPHVSWKPWYASISSVVRLELAATVPTVVPARHVHPIRDALPRRFPSHSTCVRCRVGFHRLCHPRHPRNHGLTSDRSFCPECCYTCRICP